MNNPYQQCPKYDRTHFIVRLVEENDAVGLLECYSDVKAQPIFNSDACTGDFCINRLEDMRNCINAWIGCYERQEFIRFSIIDKNTNVAVGTIEMFGMVGAYKVNRGILRVDILSKYENETYLSEIFGLCKTEFFDVFAVEQIVTKAIPMAECRIKSLLGLGFEPYDFPERENYYICTK